MAGYLTRPKMPEGAFSLSYKNGLRGILVDVPDERETRRYLSVPLKVAFYLEDAWSWCSPPTKEESARAAPIMAGQEWPGHRLDAVCKITVEGEKIVRGLIVTVPKV
jgi:hypothetical protein